MSGNALPRVLIIMPHLGDGGAERVMLDLLIELRRQALTVDMLVMRRRGPRVAEAAERGVHVDYGCGASQSLVLHSPQVLLQAIRAARRSDLVVAGLDGPTTGLAVLAARATRRPCVALVQANFVTTRDLDRRHGVVKWLMNRVSLTSRADVAVAVSEEMRYVAEQVGVPPDRARVIFNGVDAGRILDQAVDPAGRAGAPSGSLPTVVGAGRLAWEKGFDLLIRAHANARKRVEHRLLLLGAGPEHGALVALTRHLGAGDSVEFAGFVANPYPMLAGADVVCSPSRHDALSLLLLEAMLLETPLIAADCPGGTRTALDGGRFGALVPADDVDALADAIVAHLENPARLREKAAGAEAWVRERFSIERAAKEYITLFQELTAPRAARRTSRPR